MLPIIYKKINIVLNPNKKNFSIDNILRDRNIFYLIQGSYNLLNYNFSYLRYEIEENLKESLIYFLDITKNHTIYLNINIIEIEKNLFKFTIFNGENRIKFKKPFELLQYIYNEDYSDSIYLIDNGNIDNYYFRSNEVSIFNDDSKYFNEAFFFFDNHILELTQSLKHEFLEIMKKTLIVENNKIIKIG